MADTRKIGQQGEQLAVDYLRKHGYEIISTNWRCKEGELDIVARQGEVLVFVEVKTRQSATNEAAFASISPNKRQHLVAAVYMYLQEHQQDNIDWRIDVIAIALSHNAAPLIEHVEDALDW